MNLRIGTAAVVAALWASGASATVVNFDALAANEVLTDQIPGMSFSSSVGAVAVFNDVLFAQTTPNSIGPMGDGGFNFNAPLTINFDFAVNNLSFWSIGGNVAGQQSTIDVYGLGGALLASVALNGAGDPGIPDFHDLSAYANIAQIRIRANLDPGGLNYDTFSFDFTDLETPLPGAFVLLLTGLAGLGAAGRRKARA